MSQLQTMPGLVKRQPQKGGGWPGLSPRLANVFSQVMKKQIPANLNDITIVPWTYFHRVTLATNNNMATELQFFNAQFQGFVTNLPQPGYIPSETAFALQSVAVTLETGLTAAGAAEVNGAQLVMSATVGVAALNLVEALRAITIGGQLRLRVGDRVIADCRDLSNFAAGHGPGVNGSAIAGPTNTLQVLPYNNGVPAAPPNWRYDPWFPILPGKQIGCSINWASAITLAANTSVHVTVELSGIRVTPSNL
jgi:hypothetical protein